MKKKITLLLLCAIILLPCVVACTPNGVDTASEGAGESQSTETQPEPEKVELPENMNYDGAIFSVLTAGNVAYNDFIVLWQRIWSFDL